MGDGPSGSRARSQPIPGRIRLPGSAHRAKCLARLTALSSSQGERELTVKVAGCGRPTGNEVGQYHFVRRGPPRRRPLPCGVPYGTHRSFIERGNSWSGLTTGGLGHPDDLVHDGGGGGGAIGVAADRSSTGSHTWVVSPCHPGAKYLAAYGTAGDVGQGLDSCVVRAWTLR